MMEIVMIIIVMTTWWWHWHFGYRQPAFVLTSPQDSTLGGSPEMVRVVKMVMLVKAAKVTRVGKVLKAAKAATRPWRLTPCHRLTDPCLIQSHCLPASPQIGPSLPILTSHNISFSNSRSNQHVRDSSACDFPSNSIQKALFLGSLKSGRLLVFKNM